MRARTTMTAVALAVASIGAPAHAGGLPLRHGDSGPAVALWQRMVNRFVNVAGRVDPDALALDGVFGTKTAAATRWFERRADLKIDGVVQPRDRRNWIGSFITCCGAQKPTIYRGAYDPLVGHLQLQLNEWLRTEDRPTLVIDLLFGPRTEAAVRDYQEAHGLASDGIVGPRTWHGLLH